MNQPTATTFFALIAGRRGHFQLESGHHSELWFDLDSLFAEPRRLDPFVNEQRSVGIAETSICFV